MFSIFSSLYVNKESYVMFNKNKYSENLESCRRNHLISDIEFIVKINQENHVISFIFR